MTIDNHRGLKIQREYKQLHTGSHSPKDAPMGDLCLFSEIELHQCRPSLQNYLFSDCTGIPFCSYLFWLSKLNCKYRKPRQWRKMMISVKYKWIEVQCLEFLVIRGRREMLWIMFLNLPITFAAYDVLYCFI